MFTALVELGLDYGMVEKFTKGIVSSGPDEAISFEEFKRVYANLTAGTGKTGEGDSDDDANKDEVSLADVIPLHGLNAEEGAKHGRGNEEANIPTSLNMKLRGAGHRRSISDGQGCRTHSFVH